MHSTTLLACLSTLLGFTMGVAAQVGPAQCTSGWEWNQNSLGQDPCAIATILDSNCRNDPEYTYQKLNASEWYLPPSKTHTGDLTCDCDTVMYSLVMACSTCQGGIAYGWDAWIKECNAVLISDYSSDIPQGTAIPRWAFYNVTLLNKELFDNSNAQAIGRDPEAKPTAPKPSATSTMGKHKSKKIAAIIGGVVGGVGFLTIVVIAYFGYRWWRKSKENRLQRQWDHPEDGQWKTPPQSPTSKYTPSVSTGPTLSPNRPFQFNFSAPMPAPEANRPVTWVTPIANGGQP